MSTTGDIVLNLPTGRQALFIEYSINQNTNAQYPTLNYQFSRKTALCSN
ncbi:MAG: hypothetical protein ABIN74_12025 [Ferruginibacter sp.]